MGHSTPSCSGYVRGGCRERSGVGQCPLGHVERERSPASGADSERTRRGPYLYTSGTPRGEVIHPSWGWEEGYVHSGYQGYVPKGTFLVVASLTRPPKGRGGTKRGLPRVRYQYLYYYYTLDSRFVHYLFRVIRRTVALLLVGCPLCG